MNNTDKTFEPLPAANNSILFGTTSTDIVQGLQQNAFPLSSSEVPEDDDQIVNEQDQQEIVNPTEEELPAPPPTEGGTTLQNLPDIEKDLFDKNILEEKEVPGEENTNDIKAS